MSDPPINPADAIEIQRRQLQDKLALTQRHLAKLNNDRRRLPWLALLFLLAIPAGILWGFAGVLLAIAVALFTLGSAFYLVWGHYTEYQTKIQTIQARLRQLR